MNRIIWRILNVFLINNPNLVSKLAESYPMRRAAQLFVYLYNKHKMTFLEFQNQKQLGNLNLTEKLKKIYEDLESKNKKMK